MTWFVGFESTLENFLSMSFASTTAATPCTVHITDVSLQPELDSIASAIGNPDDPNFKGAYIKLDLSWNSIDIGDNTFEATGSNAGLASYLTGIVLPSGSIGNNAFKGCANLSSVVFPTSGLNTIGFDAFNGCTGLSGTTVTIPASCNCIGSKAFAGTGITSLADGSSPPRNWQRAHTVGGIYTPAEWYGTLSDTTALDAINANYNDAVIWTAP